MNWVDIVIILILAAFAYHGWLRGFILTLLDVLGLLIALVAAILLYPYIGGWIEKLGLQRGIANSLAFIGVFVIVEAAFWSIARRAYRGLPQSAETSAVNHAFGVIPGLVKGVLFVGLLILVVLSLPMGISRGTMERSAIGGMFLNAGSKIQQRSAGVVPKDIGRDFEFVTIKPGSQEVYEIPAVKNPKLAPNAEEEMLRLVNRDRAAHDLRPLKLDPELRQVARAHSQDMLKRGYFAHVSPNKQDPFDRMREAGVTFTKAGENLALAPNAEVAEEGLMNSPGHRRNILDPQFRKVGIGAYSAGPFRTVFTQNFRN